MKLTSNTNPKLILLNYAESVSNSWIASIEGENVRTIKFSSGLLTEGPSINIERLEELHEAYKQVILIEEHRERNWQ